MDILTGTWQQLTDHVWVSSCDPERVNAGLIVGNDHALLVDSGTCPEQGRELATSAMAIAGRPIDQLVLTHWHWDHWFGASGVAARRVIGHEGLVELKSDPDVLAEAAELGITEEAIVAPTDPISLAKLLDLGGIQVEVLHFGAAHTRTDLIVNVPAEDVVFAGDLIEEGADPQFGRDSLVRNWPNVLSCALDLSNERTKFVPGHGHVLNQRAVAEQQFRLSALFSEAERLARQGTKLSDAMTAVSWPFNDETMSVALPIVYAELAARGIVANLRLPLV